MQSQKGSKRETIANTMSGFILSWLLQWLVVPHIPGHDNGSGALFIVSMFTVISIIRGYVWRRIACKREFFK